MPDSFTMFGDRGDIVFDAKRIASILAVGNQWFVDEENGSDSNVGSSAAPFATLTKALASATPDNGDVVYLNESAHVTATVAWNKDGVNLIGIQGPSGNGRARISSTGATPFSPLVNVTSVGCSFINIGTFHGGFTAATGSQVCWAEAGGRNYYSQVQFLGGGDATTAALAGMRSLTISSGENLFDGCSIGLDTIVRATNANASLEFLSGAPRNTFRRCIFQALVSDVSNVFVTVGEAGMDRYAYFDECAFLNSIESTGSTMSAAITAHAAAGGAIVLRSPVFLGVTAVATTGPVYIVGSTPAATTSGIAIKAT